MGLDSQLRIDVNELIHHVTSRNDKARHEKPALEREVLVGGKPLQTGAALPLAGGRWAEDGGATRFD